jgi:hypothetical protein
MPPTYEILENAKVYRCHAYFATGEKGIVGFFVLLIMLTWLLPVASLASGGVVTSYPLRLAVSMSFTLCCVLLLALFVNREIRQVRYIIAQGALTRVGSTSRRTVRFASVTTLRRGPFGMIELRSPESVIRIPLIVAGLPRLIDDIREGLDGAGSPVVPDGGNIDALRRRAVVNELSTARLQREFPRAWIAAQWFFVLGAAAARFLWHWPLFLAVAWALVGMVMPVAALAAADLLLSRRAHAALRTGRDPADVDEDRVLIIVGAAALLVYLAAGIAARIALEALMAR